MSRRSIKFLVLILICGLFGQIFAETINVGGYTFPPFLEKKGDNYVGVVFDIIEELNNFQDKYEFQFVPTASRRRTEHFEKKIFDIIMFEDIAWGWSDRNDVVASKVFLEGGEVYIAKADPSRNQSYFDDLSNKSIAGILGYHYGFAGFSGDDKYLKENFDIQLSTSHEGNIRKVLAGRSDVSVVTLSYLNKYLKENPDKRNQLLISDKFDQRFHHTILFRKNGKISVDEMNALITGMENSGAFARIWAKYGIE